MFLLAFCLHIWYHAHYISELDITSPKHYPELTYSLGKELKNTQKKLPTTQTYTKRFHPEEIVCLAESAKNET